MPPSTDWFFGQNRYSDPPPPEWKVSVTGFFNPSPDRWFAKWKWKWMFLIKCYSDKAHFSEFWSVAPLPSTWKHHFEGKGAWLPGHPGAPNTPKTGVLGAPGAMLLFLRNDVSKSKEKEQLTKIQKNELCLNNILSKTSTFTFIWLSAIRVRVKNPVRETFHSGGGVSHFFQNICYFWTIA